MDQESSKHFVQIEKPALLSEAREVRLQGEGLSQTIKETLHKAGCRDGWGAWEWEERHHLHSVQV
jgi:hypothetical protein